jgi:pimeloyl-ACP methyl ester carboxylesterase
VRIVFLHGIGAGDPNRGWLAGLNRGLVEAGFPEVDEKRVIAPRYSSLLDTAGVSAKLPPVTYKSKDDSRARREFERRQAKVQRKLGLDETVRSFGWNRFPEATLAIGQQVGINALPYWDLPQVKRYMQNEGLRAAILKRILDDLPGTGDIVLIGHSLGSVVAIDLLDNLHEGLHVRRFITIGSPASSRYLHEGSDRLLKTFPYARVDDWSNFFDARDVVTGGRGLASTFPGAQDFAIDIGGSHAAGRYLDHHAVSGLVAEKLYPSKSPALRESNVAVRLGDQEASILLSLYFGHAVQRHIKDQGAASRYADALSAQQDEVIAQISRVAATANFIVAPELYELVSGKLPLLPHRWELHEAVGELVVLSMTNLVEPHEINVERAPKAALVDMAVEMGLQRSTGTKIGTAIEEVQNYISRRGGVPWGRVLTAAVGVAIVAAGPIGLAVAAPAGVFGAAALTGGLAALGPGGMVGGLAMLGGLAGTGAAVATSAATAGSGTDQPVNDSNTLVLRVAAEYARKKLGLPFDEGLWYQISGLETQLSARINRLSVYSDPKSPTLEALRAGRYTLSRLMLFMLEKGLGPKALNAAENEVDRLLDEEQKRLDAQVQSTPDNKN